MFTRIHVSEPTQSIITAVLLSGDFNALILHYYEMVLHLISKIKKLLIKKKKKEKKMLGMRALPENTWSV